MCGWEGEVCVGGKVKCECVGGKVRCEREGAKVRFMCERVSV